MLSEDFDAEFICKWQAAAYIDTKHVDMSSVYYPPCYIQSDVEINQAITIGSWSMPHKCTCRATIARHVGRYIRMPGAFWSVDIDIYI